MDKKLYFSRGQISRTLIILGIILLFLIAVVYFSLRWANNASKQKNAQLDENQIPEPVYEVTLNDVRFLLDSSIDMGSVLAGAFSRAPSFQENLTTTEKFIWVIVRAQNKGKVNTTEFSWDLGNIVDSEGRNFVPITNKAFYWLPQPDLCGAVLKPEFEPTPCVRVYEVSKASTNLKIQVMHKPDDAKQQKGFIDLKVEK